MFYCGFWGVSFFLSGGCAKRERTFNFVAICWDVRLDECIVIVVFGFDFY